MLPLQRNERHSGTDNGEATQDVPPVQLLVPYTVVMARGCCGFEGVSATL